MLRGFEIKKVKIKSACKQPLNHIHIPNGYLSLINAESTDDFNYSFERIKIIHKSIFRQFVVHQTQKEKVKRTLRVSLIRLEIMGMFILKAFSRLKIENNDIKHFHFVSGFFTVHSSSPPCHRFSCSHKLWAEENETFMYINTEKGERQDHKMTIIQEITDLFNANEYNFHLRSDLILANRLGNAQLKIIESVALLTLCSNCSLAIPILHLMPKEIMKPRHAISAIV